MKRTESATATPILTVLGQANPIATIPAQDFSMSDLLATVQAFDGSKDARYAVAHDAIRRAYRLALFGGRTHELEAVRTSTGKGKHIKAMREAVTLTGTPKAMKDCAARDNMLDTLTAECLARYVDVAFAPAIKREPKPKTKAVAPSEAGPDTGAPVKEETATPPAPATLDVMGWLAMLDDEALAAHANAVLDMIAKRAANTMQRAA